LFNIFWNDVSWSQKRTYTGQLVDNTAVSDSDSNKNDNRVNNFLFIHIHFSCET